MAVLAPSATIPSRAGWPSAIQRDDERLAMRLRRGERDALRDVYAQYGTMTFGLLLSILRDRAAAEDVQQQVFLEVWQRGRAYDPDVPPSRPGS